MKNLFFILLCGVTIGVKSQENLQEVINYSFQINYINFIQSGDYNLQGFRLTYWPREYRTPYYYRASPSLAGQGLYGNSVRRVYPNNNNVGILFDVAFTPPDSIKANEEQLVSIGIMFPIVDNFMFHLGVGSRWNNGVGVDYESDVIATYGLSYVLDKKGLTFTLARQPKRLREMFTRGEASTMVGIGYTFTR